MQPVIITFAGASDTFSVGDVNCPAAELADKIQRIVPTALFGWVNSHNDNCASAGIGPLDDFPVIWSWPASAFGRGMTGMGFTN
jgi:hypothetical protein